MKHEFLFYFKSTLINFNKLRATTKLLYYENLNLTYISLQVGGNGMAKLFAAPRVNGSNPAQGIFNGSILCLYT